MNSIFYQFFSRFFFPPLLHLFILTIALILIFIESTAKLGKRILVFGIILFYLSSSYWFVNLLSAPLESPFSQPNLEHVSPPAGAIVVLTGGKFYTRLRTIWGVELHQRFKDLPLIISGGPIFREEDNLAESEIAAEIAKTLGVPAEKIIVEKKSKNTYENAYYTSEILKEKNIKNFFLVTSGFHMYRAMAVFKKQGFTPVPVPYENIYSRSEKKKISFIDNYIPSSEAFHSLFYVLHEYAGLLWYKINGYIM
jgi:uncharacterized SAM-binding protein YcdF (DUF218 family)